MSVKLFDSMVFPHPLYPIEILDLPPTFGTTFKKLLDLDCISATFIILKLIVNHNVLSRR